MLPPKRVEMIKQIGEKVALLVVLLALVDMAYIILTDVWGIANGLIALPQRGWIFRYGLSSSVSLMWPLSMVLLLMSLPTLKPHIGKLKIRTIGSITAAFMIGGIFICALFSKHSLLNLIVPPIFMIFSVSIILFLLFLTAKNWHGSTLMVTGIWFTVYSFAFFKLPYAIKFGLPPIYLIFGLLNITAGYINLKDITPKVEKILWAEIVLLFLLGLYRLYITGGKLL
jgi:hypothetical protein